MVLFAFGKFFEFLFCVIPVLKFCFGLMAELYYVEVVFGDQLQQDNMRRLSWLEVYEVSQTTCERCFTNWDISVCFSLFHLSMLPLRLFKLEAYPNIYLS
uniref:Uncharacterized protein n=1 Tax=Salix viminalis TaxID=40686 RepID=A0A6N2MIY5_SALVM